MNIINKIKNIMEAKNKVKELGNTGNNVALNHKRFLALGELENYSLSFSYIKTNKTRDMVKEFILVSDGRSYMGKESPYSKVAEEFQCTERNVRNIVSKVSETLEEIIGDSVELILRARSQDEIEGILNQFRGRIATVDISKVIVKGVDLPEAKKSNTLKTSDCINNALVYLKFLTNTEIEATTKAMSEQLSHVLYIMTSGDEKYSKERQLFSQFLEGNIALNKVVDDLKDR